MEAYCCVVSTQFSEPVGPGGAQDPSLAKKAKKNSFAMSFSMNVVNVARAKYWVSKDKIPAHKYE